MLTAKLSRPIMTIGAAIGLALQLPSLYAAGPIPDVIPKSAFTIELQSIASGLASPTYLTDAGDGSGRLFVADQVGKISVIKNGAVSTFLDLSSRLPSNLGNLPIGFGDYDERGLLGLAFHPEFSNPNSAGFGRFYTYTSEDVAGPGDYGVGLPLNQLSHQNVVAEWRIDKSNPDVANALSRRELLRVDHPQFNHDGGMLAFGPDHNLYIGIGDGGNANDVGDGHSAGGNAQDLSRVHGKILRIDVEGHDGIDGQYGIPANNPFVDTSGAAPEIFAEGFRNPFRFSFDKQTGDLVVADVGQNNVEEVDVVTSGGNYGWNFKEGSFKFNPADGTVSTDLSGLPGDLIDPALQYDHDEGIAIIGGFVYRGDDLPGLQGKYIFGDYSRDFGPTGRLFAGDLATGVIEELKIGLDDRTLGFYLKGLGQDADGELYALVGSTLGLGIGAASGQVLKLVAAPVPLPAAFWLFGPTLALLGARRRHA